MCRLRIGFATLIRRASADKKSVPPVCSRQPLMELATWRGESHGFTSSRYGLHRREALAAAVASTLTSLGLPRSARATSGVRVLASPEQLRPVYDYVIVGAGSAGCVLAYRFGRAGRRILIIEAGGPAKLSAVEDPPQWPTLQGGPLDWRYATTPHRLPRCEAGHAYAARRAGPAATPIA